MVRAARQVSQRNFAEGLSKKADVATLDQFQSMVKQDLTDTSMAIARKADASTVEELAGRAERLRARVEADSDTTAAALRTISSTFDTTLADVRSRLEGCNGQVVALNRNMAALEQQLREQDLTHRCGDAPWVTLGQAGSGGGIGSALCSLLRSCRVAR